ncbi:MAG: putative lipid II flippase FtsW [bacterium]|nr:putative lipid II flippase FtsW [bacterium]
MAYPYKINSHLSIFLIALFLMAIGITMVYSASAILANEWVKDSYYFLKKQLLGASIGIILALLMGSINYKALQKIVKPVVIVCMLFLALTLIPELSKEAGGARRWFKVGFLVFSPLEFIKVAAIIFIADYLARKEDLIKNFEKGLFPILIVLGILFVIILIQRSLGTVIIIGAVAFSMLIIGGARIGHILGTILLILPFAYSLIYNVDYRKRRILAFLNPWDDPSDKGYHIIQSFLALGSGGLFGKGLGESKQKLFYLPAPHTDFIFSVIGEEVGCIGTTFIIILFIIFAWIGFKIAASASDLFGRYLAFGITTMISSQALLNIGVVTGVVPTTGVPLPFISFGNSSLISVMMGVGMLISVSKKNRYV